MLDQKDAAPAESTATAGGGGAQQYSEGEPTVEGREALCVTINGVSCGINTQSQLGVLWSEAVKREHKQTTTPNTQGSLPHPNSVVAVRKWLMPRQKDSSPAPTVADCCIRSPDRMVMTTVTRETV